MTPYQDVLLQEILSLPTAPFREGHILRRITEELSRSSVPFFQDPIGNLILGVSNKNEYSKVIREKTKDPLRLFIAHLDHPGFHGVQWNKEGDLEVKWHGGTPTQHLVGAKVWIADKDGWAAYATLKEASLVPSGRSIDTATLKLNERLRKDFFPNQIAADSLYGGFRFRSPYWKEGDLIYTKAADDLVGSFAIVSLAIDFFKKKKKKDQGLPFLGLLTRAEEVGFIGAIGHFNLGWHSNAKRQILCVSLETSRALPGAEIGKGPVVRLGDRYTVFDSGALRIFSDLAQATLPEKHQRRVMDGGTCEATAATVFGFQSIGISIPLGNYHNQSFEGGPDALGPLGPAPEFVHSQDIEGLLTLCHALVHTKQPWANPWQNKMREFKKNLRDYRSLLRSGP